MTIVAACQLCPQIGEIEANRRAVEVSVAEASAAGARLVVLPELCDTGYVFTGREEAEALVDTAPESATLDNWRALALRLDLVIVGGFCERSVSGALYNSAAIVDRSGVRCVYRKAHLWDREQLVFTAGDSLPPVVETDVGRVGVLICYDLEFPEWVRKVALAGADLVAAPTNWPSSSRPAGERPAEVVKVQANAAVNGVYIVVADRGGEERGVTWVSGSAIIGPDGYPLAGPVLEDRPALLLAEVDVARARDKKLGEYNDLFLDRREGIYSSGAVSFGMSTRPGDREASSAVAKVIEARPFGFGP